MNLSSFDYRESGLITTFFGDELLGISVGIFCSNKRVESVEMDQSLPAPACVPFIEEVNIVGKLV